MSLLGPGVLGVFSTGSCPWCSGLADVLEYCMVLLLERVNFKAEARPWHPRIENSLRRSPYRIVPIVRSVLLFDKVIILS